MRQKLASFSLFVLLATTLDAATSSVKITMEEGSKKLPNITATRLVMNDGTTKMYLLFAEKSPKSVVVVDATGSEGLSLGAWTTAEQTMAVKISFVEGAHENYSMNVHNGAESIALGGHHSGDDGLRGPFKKLEIKGDTVRGTLQSGDGPAIVSGNFETTFNTLREPKPITGAAIAASPQGKALLAYAAAMRKLDFAGAARYSVNDDSAQLNRMDKKEVKEMMQQEFGRSAAEFEKMLATSGVMVGDGSEYHIRVKQGTGSVSSTASFGIRNIDGVWKVNY